MSKKLGFRLWKHGKGNDTRSAGIRQGTGKLIFCICKDRKLQRKECAEFGIRLDSDNKSEQSFL